MKVTSKMSRSVCQSGSSPGSKPIDSTGPSSVTLTSGVSGWSMNSTISAICRGLQLLTAAGVLKGRACTAYPAVGPEVTMAGGRFLELPADRAHAEGNLITAPAWPAQAEWLAKLLHVLGSRIEA